MRYLLTSLALGTTLCGCAALSSDPRLAPSAVLGAEPASAPPAAAPLTATEQRQLDRAMAEPRSAEPWFELGNYYAANNRLAAAEHAYREALKRESSPKTLHNLGLVQVRLGVDALQQAQRRLPPDDPARARSRAFLEALLSELP